MIENFLLDNMVAYEVMLGICMYRVLESVCSLVFNLVCDFLFGKEQEDSRPPQEPSGLTPASPVDPNYTPPSLEVSGISDDWRTKRWDWKDR